MFHVITFNIDLFNVFLHFSLTGFNLRSCYLLEGCWVVGDDQTWIGNFRDIFKVPWMKYYSEWGWLAWYRPWLHYFLPHVLSPQITVFCYTWPVLESHFSHFLHLLAKIYIVLISCFSYFSPFLRLVFSYSLHFLLCVLLTPLYFVFRLSTSYFFSLATHPLFSFFQFLAFFTFLLIKF